MLEEPESACSKNLAESTATDECARPGQNSRIHCGVTRLSSPNSSGVSSHACVSFLDALLAAPARAPAALTAARRVAPFSAVVGLGMHDDGSSVHDACSNSWSDTVRVKGPTGTRRVKGGASGPAEDLRPVSEVEAGVNFRPAGCVRGRLQVPFPGGNQAQVPGVSGKVRSHLPFTRRFLVSNSCHLDTDWASGNRWAGRRCVELHDRGFGCLRGTPELVCHLPILTTFGWDGGSRVHTPITPSGMGLLVCGAGSRPSCHLGVVRRNCQRG